MPQRFLAGIGAGLIVALILLWNALFIVQQTQRALVLQFGQTIRVIDQPGLAIKLPFVQNVVLFDARVLDYEPRAEEVIAADQKRLVVDSYARYRIVAPLKFYQSVGTESELNIRLGATISGSLRRVLGNVVLAKLLSPDRATIMAEIRQDVAAQAEAFGVDVIDVRIRRADLPAENSEAIYSRMKSEREREAKEFRAQGAELAVGIRARADRERTVILADATKQAQILRGEGDANSIKIYADAYGQDPEFYAFYRSLEAYGRSLDQGTTMVMSPNSEFLKFFAHGRVDAVVMPPKQN